MKRLLVMASGLFVLGIAVAGCQNTGEGMKEDTQKNGQAAQNAAGTAVDNTKAAADNTKDAAMNAGDALSMTPKVKLAIVNNTKLNDTRNLINVDTKDNTVYLKGHVISNDEKKLAGEIAAKTIKDAGSSDKVMNQLTVATH